MRWLFLSEMTMETNQVEKAVGKRKPLTDYCDKSPMLRYRSHSQKLHGGSFSLSLIVEITWTTWKTSQRSCSSVFFMYSWSQAPRWRSGTSASSPYQEFFTPLPTRYLCHNLRGHSASSPDFSSRCRWHSRFWPRFINVVTLFYSGQELLAIYAT